MTNLELMHRDILTRLKNDFRFEESGDYLTKGVCPECGKKELFTKLDKPYYIVCNRRSKCAYETTIKHLMPELFENLNERFPPTQQDPNATAKIYLQNRGLDPEKMADWYEQGHYWRSTANRKTATVKFYLTPDKSVYWERLIEPVELTKEDGSKELIKHNFSTGKRAGLWWMPPNQVLKKGDTVYFCEGILKAVALLMVGKKAVSIMSSSSFPSLSIAPYLNQNINWVWALDSDDAGRKATHSHHEKLKSLGEKSSAIFATEYPRKLDWDELSPTSLDAQSFVRYVYYGRLELCSDYHTKAYLMWDKRNQDTDSEDETDYFCFDFAKNGYSVTAKRKEYEKQLKSLGDIDGEDEHKNKLSAFISTSEIKRISTFAAQFLYFQKFEDTDEGEYVFKFRMANNAHDQIVGFSHLSKADSFREKCQRLAAGANFMGTTADLSWLYNRWMAHKPPTINILPYIGYYKEHDAYIFNKIAVQGKKVIPINGDDFFPLKKCGVKTSVNTPFTINPTINLNWLEDYKTAFGVNGLVALAWWVSTFYIQQIRTKHKDFPYLSIIGKAGTGKTDLINFLYKMTGLDGAKMPLNPNVDTLSGFYTSLAKYGNVPILLNEVDNEQSLEHMRGKHTARFNWNTLKQLYDGENIRTRSRANSRNTEGFVFKSNLIVSQNVDISDASEAIVTRFCNIPFDFSHHSPQGKTASLQLIQRDIQQTSGFLLHCITQSHDVLAEFDKQFTQAIPKIARCNELNHSRIKDTHAKLLAFANVLPFLLPSIGKHDLADVEHRIIEMAIQRQQILNGDHPLVSRFWEMFDDFNTEIISGYHETDRINHSKNRDLIAVHLPSFTKRCQDKYGTHSVIDIDELRRLLPTSKDRTFVEYKPVDSKIENKTMKCYVFKREK